MSCLATFTTGNRSIQKTARAEQHPVRHLGANGIKRRPASHSYEVRSPFRKPGNQNRSATRQTMTLIGQPRTMSLYEAVRVSQPVRQSGRQSTSQSISTCQSCAACCLGGISLHAAGRLSQSDRQAGNQSISTCRSCASCCRCDSS